MALRNIDYYDIKYIISRLQNMRNEIPICAESEDDPDYVYENLKRMILDDSFIGYISKGQGFMFGAVSASWYDKRLKAYEQLLYVEPDFRKSSFGSRLITEFCNGAKERGACEIIAGTSLGYRTASIVRLYERKGFTQIGASLKLKLE